MGRENNDEPKNENEYEQRKRTARLAGLMYLSVIIFGIGAQVVRMSLIDAGDAAATVENISSNETAWRLCFVSDLIMTLSYSLLGVVAFMLFEQFNKRVALAMLVFVAVSAAVGGLSLLHQYTVLHLIDADYMSAIGADQVAAQVMLQLDMHNSGTIIAQLLGWGPWLFPLGYLGYRSGYFPKALGIMLMAACFGLVIGSLQYFLLPEMEVLSIPGLAISAVTEFVTCGWLLVKGVRAQAF